MTGPPAAAELLARDGALLGVDDLRELGFDEPAIRRVLREVPEVALPNVRRIYYAAEDIRKALHR